MKIPIISFFSGGGFLDMGFEEAGFQTVWNNEYNTDIADLFEHGMTALRRHIDPLAPVAQISSRKSIEDLKADEILSEVFCGQRPNCFGVIGGPPCPDFSKGGKNRGHEGDHGKLTKCYIEMICEMKPDFFLMENVPGLVRTLKHRLFLEKLRCQLNVFGYVTDLKILNALEYGAPQDRERVFMVGLTEEFYFKISGKKLHQVQDGWFPFPKPVYPYAKNCPWPKTSTFGINPNKPEGIIDELTLNPLLASSPPPTEMPNGSEYFVAYSNKFKEVPEGDDSRKSFKRLHRYRYSPTVCYGNNEVHLHPWEPRRISVREALRIQTIPDEYVLPSFKPLSTKFKMIANGVPRLLAKRVASSLRDFLLFS